MNIITEPKVEVIGVSKFIPHSTYEIPEDGTDADKLCSFAAKGCYDSYGAGGRSNVENQTAVLESLHGSVIEHFHISFFIEGITRGLSLELNRHRPFNISQRSTRYTKEEEAAIVLEPYYAELYTKYKSNIVSLAGDEFEAHFDVPNDYPNNFNAEEFHLIVSHLQTVKRTIDQYKGEVGVLVRMNPNGLSGFDLRKWARGKARNILPHGLETRGTWTNNLRGLRWFVEARSNRHAEPEIRRLADLIFIKCREIAPTHFADFKTKIVNGIPEHVPTYNKV